MPVKQQYMSLVKSIFLPQYSETFKKMSVSIFFKLLGIFALIHILTNITTYYFLNSDSKMGLLDIPYFYLAVLVSCVAQPLLYDLITLLWLKKGRHNAILSIVISSLLLFIYGFNLIASIVFNNTYSFDMILEIIPVLIVLISMSISRIKPNLFTQHYHYFYYSSALSLLIISLTNMPSNALSIPLLILLYIIPSVASIIITLYTRITYGFMYSYLMSVLVSLSLVLFWL